MPEAAVHSDRRVATDADPEASAADAPEPRDAGRAAVDARIERADATSIRDAVASAESGPRRCDTMDVWYADGDGDGYGDPAEAYVGCSEPSTSNWVRSNEDCNDDDPRVHPGQRDYFGAPFSHAGEASFDYDCSGAEEADPLQAAAPHECGLLSIALCEGSGYLPTGRTATRVHELCGSTRLAVCQPSLGGLLFCESVVQHTTEPFRCR